MAQSYDIVIIGAGIIGMATAWQLARRSRARILVIEKGYGPGEGSTGASSAVCRFRYTHAETVRLALDGVSAYQNWSEFTGLATPRASFHKDGALWLGHTREHWAEDEADRLAALGVRTIVLDDQALHERFPAINPCLHGPDLENEESHDCSGGRKHLLEVDGGYVDPVDAVQDLVECARRAGVELLFGKRVADVLVQGGKLSGVKLESGEQVHCSSLVCAAGPWCEAIYRMAGLHNPWPLRPTRIQVAHLARPQAVAGDLPVTVDLPGGIYFRLQNRGQQIIVGSVLEEDECEFVDDPDQFARYADDEFIRSKLHVLAHRLPGLGNPSQVRGYSGLYTMNREDVHPVVGLTPIDGLYVANGFSGHGFKLAPAIGSILAQLLSNERDYFDTNVDPLFLAFDRRPIQLENKSVLA